MLLKSQLARHENTQWSTANAKTMSLGVSVAGNILNLKDKAKNLKFDYH